MGAEDVGKDGVVEINVPAGQLRGSNTVTLNIRADPTVDRAQFCVPGAVTSEGWGTGRYDAALVAEE